MSQPRVTLAVSPRARSLRGVGVQRSMPWRWLLRLSGHQALEVLPAGALGKAKERLMGDGTRRGKDCSS